MRTRYFVVFAPGHYGGSCRVLSAHRSYRAALDAIEGTTTLCVREGHKARGDIFFRVDEPLYPYAFETEGA